MPAAKTSAIPIDPTLSQLRLIAIPRLSAGGRWRVEAMRSISEPCFLWFTKGQGRITISGVTRGYTAHNAIFVPAGVMHGFEAGPQVFGTAVFFGRDCTVTLPTSPQHLRIRETHAQQELNILLDWIREMDSDIPAHDRATRHYLGLLGVWLERQSRKAEAEVPKLDATRRDSWPGIPPSWNGISGPAWGWRILLAALGVTPTHLTRCCNLACGRSASALLQDRRIFEARKLLAETKLPVGRIGTSLGFTSPAYFTRAFQHLTGKSPSAFRRTL